MYKLSMLRMDSNYYQIAMPTYISEPNCAGAWHLLAKPPPPAAESLHHFSTQLLLLPECLYRLGMCGICWLGF